MREATILPNGKSHDQAVTMKKLKLIECQKNLKYPIASIPFLVTSNLRPILEKICKRLRVSERLKDSQFEDKNK